MSIRTLRIGKEVVRVEKYIHYDFWEVLSPDEYIFVISSTPDFRKFRKSLYRHIKVDQLRTKVLSNTTHKIKAPCLFQ